MLWSWAVPKGPSMDTAHKRLAMHVEDHPVSYASFEGEIPAGNYGAGLVEIWDRGTWAPVGDAAADLQKGELKFVLDGSRLHGRFVLIRLKPRPGERGESWLLIKEHDQQERAGIDAAALEGVPLPPLAPPAALPKAARRKAPPRQAHWIAPHEAVRGALPESQAPMLATNADLPPVGDEWLSEIKFDGYRLIVRKDKAAVTVLTRNGLDWTHRLPSVASAVAALPAETLLADGELVALRNDGLSSFPDLQAALSEGRDNTLHLYLFDVLYRDGWDLRGLPLIGAQDGAGRAGAGTGLHPRQRPPGGNHRPGPQDGVLDGAGGDHLQARGRLLSRRPQPRLAEGEVPRAGGVRGGWLDAAAGQPFGPRCAAARLLRRPGRAALRGRVRQRLRRPRSARPERPSGAARVGTTGQDEADRGEAARRRRNGSGRSWWPRCNIPAGRAPGGCAMRCIWACARTRRRATWCATCRIPRRRGASSAAC